MNRREGDMAVGMPVLCHHHIRKTLGDAIDDGNDLLAVLHGEAAAGQEAVLHIDDQKCGSVIGLDRRRRPQRP